MSNTAINNKRFGFNAEAELLQYLRDRGKEAERLHLTGKEDEGDLILQDWGPYGWEDGAVVQLKTFAARTAKGEERPISPSGVRRWLRDLKDQRKHYAAHRGLSEAPEGILIVKVKNTSWDDSLVIQRLEDWLS